MYIEYTPEYDIVLVTTKVLFKEDLDTMKIEIDKAFPLKSWLIFYGKNYENTIRKEIIWKQD